MFRVARALLIAATVSGLTACGPAPPEPPVSGTIGASSVEELIDRYREAHQTEHVAELRAFYLQQGFGPGPFNRGTRMVGSAAEWMPEIFKLELVDVKPVEVDAWGAEGMILVYAHERPATKENGWIPVWQTEIAHMGTTKFLLLVRRRGVVDAPVMKVDPSLGIKNFDGVYFLHADSPVAAEVARWAISGVVPRTFRPPAHTWTPPRGAGPMMRIPNDWVPIVRPAEP